MLLVRVFWFLDLLFLVCDQVMADGNGHVIQEQTTVVTLDDKVAKLEVMVKSLQLKVEELQTDKEQKQAMYTEMGKRLMLTHSETVTLHSDVIQLLQSRAEIQDKLTSVDESVGDLQLEFKSLNFIQKELQKDLGKWKSLKDQTRRSQRKLEKRFNAKIEKLEKYDKQISQDIKVKENVCSKKIQNLCDELSQLENHIQNNTQSIKEIVRNQTMYYAQVEKKNLVKRFGNLYKVYNISHHKSDPSSTFHNTDEIDSEFMLANSIENKLWNEVGSGDEGSGEVPDFTEQHFHRGYVEKKELLLELQERDLEITTLLDMYENLKEGLLVMEGRLQEIRLGNFMEKLQESFINFTKNVLTIDQWKLASSQLINSTQGNQHQIASLTNMVFNNTSFLRELEMKISHAQTLSYQQFSLLRIHVIQLNNTVQDMKEDWNRQKRDKKTQDLPPPVYVHTISNGNTNVDTLQSRLDDLALQIVYNENRLSKIEIKMLNESLLECKKANADVFQDARIAQVENSVIKMSDASQMVQEILNQLKQELYQSYIVNRNQSEVIDVIIQDIGKIETVFPQISSIKEQIDFFQFMLPEDCHGYHRRGYKDSGVYIINPANTNLTLQVYCDLEDGDAGWTVIQKRFDGSENFDRPWIDYKNGFGDVFGEFWLGNDLIHTLTTFNSTLKIDMVDMNDRCWTVIYDHFTIESEDKNYKLSLSGFHGNISDSFSYSADMGFSTLDRDNDGSSTHCAMFYTAGWWYKHCHYGNLNGRYRIGMVWYNFDEDEWIQLKYSAMKIKPNI